MILQLKKGWLVPAYFQEKFGVDIIDHWRDAWTGHAEEGLVTLSEDRIELTRNGLLRVDSLLPAFFEAEHQGVRYT